MSFAKEAKVLVLLHHFSIFLDFLLLQKCSVLLKASIDVLKTSDQHNELHVLRLHQLLKLVQSASHHHVKHQN